MSNSQFNAAYVAQLARIRLSPEEQHLFDQQLSRILDHVRQISELNVDAVEPTAHAHPVFNITRPDIPLPGLPKSDALASAPKQAGGLFLVPKVVE